MGNSWKILASWSFSERHLDAGMEILRLGGSALDAVVAVGMRVEADPTVDSVGLGGLPNWKGL